MINKLSLALFLVVYLCAAIPNYLLAEPDPSGLINESCVEAKSTAAKLSPTDLDKLVEQAALTLILPPSGMPANVSATSTPPISFGQMPRNDLLGPTGWSLFNPKREAAIRRCSLWILSQYPILGSKHLPQICDSLTSSALLVIESKLQEELTAVAYQLMRAVPKGAVKSLVADLIPRLNANQIFFPRAVLITIGTATLPYLTDALKNADSRTFANILGVISAIDPEGKITGEALLALLNSVENDRRELLLNHLAHLPLLFPKSLPAVVAQLKTNPATSLTWKFLENISDKNSERTYPTVTLSTEEIQLTSKPLESGPEAQRTIAIQFLQRYGGGSQRLEKALVDLILSIKDVEIKSRVIELVGALFASSNQGFGALINLISAEDPTIQISAIKALSNAQLRRNEVRTQIFKLLKRTAVSSDPKQRVEIFIAAASTFNSLNLRADSLPALPYFIEALILLADKDSKELSTVKTAIANIGSAASSALIKLLDSDKSAVKIEALSLLNTLRQLDESTVEAVAFTFNDSNEEVRSAATHLVFKLIKIGNAGLNNTIAARSRRALVGGKTPEGRAKAHLILLASDPRARELNGYDVWKPHLALLTAEDKSFIFSRWEALNFPREEILKTLPTLLLSPNNEIREDVLKLMVEIADQAFVPALRDALIRSQASDGLRVVVMSLLEKLDPKRFILEQALASELTALSKNELMRLYVKAPPETVLRAAKYLLSEDNHQRQQRGLEIVAHYGPSAKSFLAAIDPLLHSEERGVRIAAARAQASLDANNESVQTAAIKKFYGGDTDIVSVESLPLLTKILEKNKDRFLLATICDGLNEAHIKLPSQCSEYEWWN